MVLTLGALLGRLWGAVLDKPSECEQRVRAEFQAENEARRIVGDWPAYSSEAIRQVAAQRC